MVHPFPCTPQYRQKSVASWFSQKKRYLFLTLTAGPRQQLFLPYACPERPDLHNILCGPCSSHYRFAIHYVSRNIPDLPISPRSTLLLPQ